MKQQTTKLSDVLSFLKNTFVGKDEIIELLGIGLIAKENAFLLGPPGTAKSAIIRMLSQCVEGGKNFEYLLTRFTEPNEIFGPFDIRKLKEGDLVTNTEGMMPEASMVFLDEIFNANSAILNSLLMALNERVFRRGKETKKLPALMFVGASNQLPEDESLNALLDRFLLRIQCDYVDTDLLGDVLLAGRKLEKAEKIDRPSISPEEIIVLQEQCLQIDLAAVQQDYISLIHHLRNAGVKISDRRAVKCQNLVAASALMCHREQAIISDFWVLKYIWDTEEQVEILAGIIDQLIAKEANPEAHPLAKFNQMPDAEALMKEVAQMQQRWENESLSFQEQHVMKDKLRYLQTRSKWVKHPEKQQYLQQAIEGLWQKMLQSL